MGPTNVALVKLYQADQSLREAQARLDAATRDVRIQERKLNELAEKQKLAQTRTREAQTNASQLELDLKSRDAQIEKFRTQQQLAKTNKEYQAFLVEINTAKVDRNKVEEEAIGALESVERSQNELKDLTAQVEAESSRLKAMRDQIGDRIASLQADIDALRPARDEAAAAVPPKARDMFERMSERYEGESMASLSKPDRRREEYVCTSCNMDLAADVYNKLHTRDELVFCPSCRRILYIPEDLPPDQAVHKVKERKERPQKAPPAAIGRQVSAFDVARSVNLDQDDTDEQATDEQAADEPGAPEADAEAQRPGERGGRADGDTEAGPEGKAPSNVDQSAPPS